MLGHSKRENKLTQKIRTFHQFVNFESPRAYGQMNYLKYMFFFSEQLDFHLAEHFLHFRQIRKGKTKVMITLIKVFVG